MNDAGDYVLGTGDDEIARLGLQHQVWRTRALDAWQRAGFSAGQTLLDVGCGPGYASIDLAEIVGTRGRVVALDRSQQFLEALRIKARGLPQLEARELDLEHAALPRVDADGAWCRWVLSFVKQPRALLARIRGALRPGGVLVLQEYFDYRSWRMNPPSPELEEFVRTVMESWRLQGGEPDIGLQAALWLGKSGFEMKGLRPIVDVVPPSDMLWQWTRAFFHSGLRRLVHLGHLTHEQARGMLDAFARCEAAPHTLMVTPAVLEIIAVRSHQPDA